MQDYLPLPNIPNLKINAVYYALIDLSKLSTGYIDLTRRFPKRLSRDNKYILVVYYYDRNYIHSIPVKNRKGTTIITTWKELNDLFKSSGVAPEIYILDNEISKDLLDAFKKEKIVHQLVINITIIELRELFKYSKLTSNLV